MATPKTPVEKTSNAKPAPRKPAARKPAPRKPAPGNAAAEASTKPAPKPASKPASKAALPAGTLAWSLGGLAIAAGAGLVAFLTRGRIATLLEDAAAGTGEGHVPTDLLDPNRNADDRAVADFRPNIDAPMSPAEREALRPATGGAPSLVADRGEMNAQTAPSN